jgi:elongation factor P
MKAADFRANSLFKMDGSFYRVVESQRVQQPRMAAFVRAKIKNIETGAVQEKRFNTGDIFPDIEITKREMQFSYADGDLYYFVDTETWEPVPVNRSMAQDALLYNNEANETLYTFDYADGKLLGINPPTFVVLTVTETEPSVAGDTARNAMINAVLESGLNIKVQMFVNVGDKVRVDTRTASYVERA